MNARVKDLINEMDKAIDRTEKLLKEMKEEGVTGFCPHCQYTLYRGKVHYCEILGRELTH